MISNNAVLYEEEMNVWITTACTSACWVSIIWCGLQIYINHVGSSSAELSITKRLLGDINQKYHECRSNTQDLQQQITEMKTQQNQLTQQLQQCREFANDQVEKQKTCQENCRHKSENTCRCKNPCDAPLLERVKNVFTC